MIFTRTEARISDCELYRYWLQRYWDENLAVLTVCMLNPSNADQSKSDPTLRRVIHFAQLWGYGGVHIVNLYARRSPKPEWMFLQENRVGPDNEIHLSEALDFALASDGKIWVAWGNGGNCEGAADKFVGAALSRGVHLICCGVTKDGAPKHPHPKGKHRIANDKIYETWTVKSNHENDEMYRCTRLERDVLDMIKAWP